MLSTNLKHLESQEEIEELLKNNANVMICCGRMGQMCIPVYKIMEQLKSKYSHVQMRDMDFDLPAASFIKSLPSLLVLIPIILTLLKLFSFLI